MTMLSTTLVRTAYATQLGYVCLWARTTGQRVMAGIADCRTEYQGEPLEMEADAEAEEGEEDLEVLVF